MEIKINSVDIPLGLAFRHGSFMKNADGATFLGLYYTLPLSGKIKLANTSVDTEGENHLGFLLHSETYFDVSESIDIGFFFGMKFGFGNALTKFKSGDSTVDDLDLNKDTSTADFTLGTVIRF